nr:lytic transglycosylase domain-containing protein [Microbacterium terrae]
MTTTPAPARRPAAAPAARWSRRRGVTGVFAAFAVVGFAAAYIGPAGVTFAEANAQEPAVTLYASSVGDAQTRAADLDAEPAEAEGFDRGGYSVHVEEPEPVVVAEPASSSSSAWSPPFVNPDPGSAQAVAYDMVKARGWGDGEFACLVALWNKESGWRVNAYNAGSGAYGIPQALPGSKMASAGADWETNAGTQISWGLGYIGGRYGTPCGAWGHSQSVGWY